MAAASSKLPADSHAALSELTRVIAELVRQTHPEAKLVVTPDSRLDADLGLDSLARIELLHRIEEAFGVRLEAPALAAIETPRELSQALHAAAGLPPPPAWNPSPALDEEASQAAPPRPERVQTLAEMLAWYAERSPQRRHVLFYRDAEAIEELDYAGLMQAAREVAAGLIERAIEPQQTVAIMLPTSLEFFYAFFGTLLAGAVPVPIYPPARLSQLEDHLRRQASILASAQARMLVTVPEARLLAQFLRAEVPTLGGVVSVPELRGAELAVRLPTLRAQDIAFIQYTSGSTGNPKGVVLTHANLLANIRAWGQAVAMRAEDVAVSWLPLYHDMGLIGAWMGSLYHGAPLVLMSPLDFLARPERWLQAIHRHRGTMTAAPNFAFELCLRRIPDQVVDNLDLSSWRLSANGAEPVSADTMERFAERFARAGFRRSALTPVYGLAECTVGLAIPPLERGVVVDRIQRDALLVTQRALPAAAEDTAALRYVACGRPLPGHEMRIVDDTGQEVAERIVGRLQFRGPSATQGYYRNPEETRKLFEGGWLNTGDIGYMAGGDLYLTSRAKDVIIRGGRNVYPYELEEAVGNLPGVRKGCVAAVGVAEHSSGTERLLVLVEKRDPASGDDDELRTRVQSLANELLGSPADEVVLLPPNSVLKTSSGKIRRAATRDAYLQGLLGRRGRSVRLQFARMALQSGYGSVRRGGRKVGAWLHAARGWTAFVLLAPLAWTAAVLSREPARAWKRSARFARLFFRMAGISVEVSGLGDLPQHGAYVLLANHGSYLDGIVLVGVLERPHAFIAKKEFLAHAVSRWFLSAIGSLYVERFDTARGVEDVQRFTEHARAGSRLAIFPEGTFTRQSGLRPFLMGAFVIATDAGVPVVPTTISGAREILRDGSWFPVPGPVRIRIGEPIAPRGSGWEAAADLRSRARRAMLAQGTEPALDSAVLADKRRQTTSGV